MAPTTAEASVVSAGTICPSLVGCYEDYNWAGYVVQSTPNSVTKASGYWTVPAVVGAVRSSCPDAERTWGDVSVWVGIDGFNGTTVEQAGTSSDCFYGHLVYYAWYEFYPAPSVSPPAADTVKAGDSMQATINYVGSNSSGPMFTVTLRDLPRWNFTSNVTVVPGAERNSAEWVVESGYFNGFLALEHVTQVSFMGCLAWVNGVKQTIGQWSPNDYALVMVNYQIMTLPLGQPLSLAYVKAYPLPLTGSGDSFKVNWVSPGP
jgi:hypothetical protein